MAKPELQVLFQALAERGLAATRESIVQAFESSETRDGCAAWVRRYISPDTLLTREEHVFHSIQPRQVPVEPCAGHHVLDESLEAAISSLEASTASIEKQCRLLETQKRAIEDLIQRSGADRYSQKDRKKQTNSTLQEKAQLDFEQLELSESLRGNLQASLKQSENAIASIPQSIDRVIEKDDRLLDGLEKVLSQLSPDAEETDSNKEVERLCEALISQLNEDVHLQIDIAYHEAIQNYRTQLNGNVTDKHSDSLLQQKGSLQVELEELCKEIDGLSVMAVDNQYRQPISRALQMSRQAETTDKASWYEYLAAAFEYITARMDILGKQHQHTHSHKHALTTVSNAFETVLTTGIDSKKNPERSPVKQSQKGLKPLRLVQANLSESQDPVTQLLRSLDVRTSDPSDVVNFSESLRQTVEDQHSKLSSLSLKSERAMTDMLAQSLVRAEKDAQALREAAYAPSDTSEVKLMSSRVQKGIDGLETDTQDVGNEMRALDMDNTATMLREKRKTLLDHLQK